MTLGRLTRIDPRAIWPREAQDFTPWLAGEANLPLLSDTLGLDLELEAVEQNVGPFRADILCKDTLTGRFVLIENQLERTDHTHLGQLLTYAAGLDAVTIIWIAAKVTDEHRAALDWLNEITAAEIRFFALEVELWRIGDSPVAPKFNVVCQPNDWSRRASVGRQGPAQVTPLQQMQREYWAGVQALIGDAGGALRPVSPPAQSWLVHGIGRTGVLLGLSMNTRANWIRVEIYLTGKRADADWAALLAQRAGIDAALGPLDWQALPGKADYRICLARPDTDPTERDDWPAQHAWLAGQAARIHAGFRPYVARLSAQDRKDPSA